MMESFDPSSGLVYREMTSNPVRSMIPKWSSYSRGRRVDPSKYRCPTTGCSSLQSMVLRTCIWNVDDMELEALQWLGWSYASRLYDHLKSTDTLTFRTWTLFQKAFPQDIDRHSTFRVHDRLEGLLPSVVERLAKLDLGVLTFLCIEAIDMTIDELVALNKIKTLAVLALEIGKNTRNGAISVQTIRDWGRSVGESGAFKSLQVLVIDTYIALPRRLVLKSVSAFPSLKLVGVYSPLPPATADCWENWRLRSPHPYSEWVSSGSTKALAMQQLYDAPTSANTCRFLSIHYTQGNKIAREDNIAWFVRELKDEPDRSKRTGGHKPPLHSKKRKVRDDKKVDMGLLLSSFT